MSFEWLPNEICLQLFDYFDGTDLFQAFYGLNARFNALLGREYRTFRFDFKSRTKRHFDMICQSHLPNITDRIVLLDLSNGDDTPEQVNLFLSYIPSLDQFIHLRSLSLSKLDNYATIMRMINQCHHLPDLIHLKCHYCHHPHMQSVFDNIWSLPKLIHCDISISASLRLDRFLPKKISASLERVSLMRWSTALNQIAELVQSIPRLKHLSITVKNVGFDYQLKHIITNYLPKLKQLEFQMNDNLDSVNDVPEYTKKLIDSFRSSFWLDEHRWFVRCFVLPTIIHLCTLSNVLRNLRENLPDSFLSTCPDDNLQQFCNDIKQISNETFFDTPIPSNIRLSQIERLELKLPINDQFWSIVPTLERLHSLTVYLSTDTCQSQMQTLLDRAPHLSELIIFNDGPSSISPFKYTNTSIRQLDICNSSYYFTEEESMAFARSSLAGQCEVLSIGVRNRQSILSLIHNMNNLRFLNLNCKELTRPISIKTETGGRIRKITSTLTSEFLQWLTEHLPSTYLISKHPYSTSAIQIWM